MAEYENAGAHRSAVLCSVSGSLCVRCVSITACMSVTHRCTASGGSLGGAGARQSRTVAAAAREAKPLTWREGEAM